MISKHKHYSLVDLNKELPSEVSKLYKFVNKDKRSSTKFLCSKFGSINLKTITIKEIEHLMKVKCPYFVKK